LKLLGMMGKRPSGLAAAAGLLVAGTVLSGCMGSPTYGTDKTANEQLFGDVSSILSLAPPKRTRVDYKPRPELVRPVKGAPAALPPPQRSITDAGNSAWPESPEQKRARLRAEADENSDNPAWRPQIEPDMARATAKPLEPQPLGGSARFTDSGVQPVGLSTSKQGEAFRKKLAEERQGNPTKRKYLSEPPLDYRQASATAPVGDLGEDEFKKERRLKAEARKKGDRSWGDILPW
jgi:hypothetical protein